MSLSGADRHGRLASAPIDTERHDEFIRGPKWRTRTSPARRHRAATVTFALVVTVGVAVLGLLLWLLTWLGAPTWLAVSPWLLPTAATVIWALVRPVPAVVSDDDDDAWTTYSIQYVIVGEDEPRAAPVRLVAATLFGAPVLWSLVVFGLSTLVGLY